jgi:DNA polymerase III subunit epsilon
MTVGHNAVWSQAPLLALDLEGTGAQDRDDEAILEIALIPITNGHPVIDQAYTSLINPGRPIPRRPWISPGLTDQTVADAPALADIEPTLAAKINDRIIVGHNIAVDWRLLHRHCPTIHPAALIDTLRLARHLRPGQKRNSLSALLDHYQLTEHLARLAPGSRPHRALWDTIGAALLIRALINDLPNTATLTIRDLKHLAGLARTDKSRGDPEQLPLLDP